MKEIKNFIYGMSALAAFDMVCSLALNRFPIVAACSVGFICVGLYAYHKIRQWNKERERRIHDN